jgi:2'-5' RNA ligase
MFENVQQICAKIVCESITISGYFPLYWLSKNSFYSDPMDTKKVFLALPVEPREPVSDIMKLLRKKLYRYRIKWVEEEKFHLTLYFFGEVPVGQIPELLDILKKTLSSMPSFTFSITAPGLFKSGREPRVLWLGSELSKALIELKLVVDQAIGGLGFPPDLSFRPHLTLGRFAPHQKVHPALFDILNEIQFMEPMNFRARELILFESRQLPKGTRYHPIGVFPLSP